MLIEREYQNALRSSSPLRAKSELTSRYSSSSQCANRFQRDLENRGCPVRLSQRKSDEIRWLG